MEDVDDKNCRNQNENAILKDSQQKKEQSDESKVFPQKRPHSIGRVIVCSNQKYFLIFSRFFEGKNIF